MLWLRIVIQKQENARFRTDGGVVSGRGSGICHDEYAVSTASDDCRLARRTDVEDERAGQDDVISEW